VALVTFDMKPKMEVDFTQNKDEVRNALYHLYFPGFSESNVYDALLGTPVGPPERRARQENLFCW